MVTMKRLWKFYKTAPEKIVEEAYLGTVARFPTKAEKDKVLEVFKEATQDELRPSVEDMYWALLSSKEFLFNH